MELVLSFEKAEQAAARVRERLMRACQALEGAGVDFAVIGGNAVAAWVESVDRGAGRNTKDVDVLMARSDLDRAARAMSEVGFELAEVAGVTMFLDREDPLPSRGVHLVFSGEKVRPEYAHAAPDTTHTIRTAEGVRALGLLELVMMKLQSNRLIDQVHILDLLSAGLVTDDLADRLPADLRQRLDRIRSHPDS